jgi:hypothetical protein
MKTLTTLAPYATSWEHIQEELGWLHRLLSLRLEAEPAGSVTALADLALCIRHRREVSMEQGVHLALPNLARTFHLSPFEEHCLLLCLAPEVDRKYDRLYAHLQDDATRRKPTVGLAIELLCGSPDEALAARVAFDPGSPLLRGRLVQIAGGSLPLPGRSLKLDDRIAELLLGSRSVAPALGDAAELTSHVSRRPWLANPDLRARLGDLIRTQLSRSEAGLLVHLHGPGGSGKRELVQAVCGDLGLPLVIGDVGRMLEGSRSFAETVWLFAREAVLQPAALAVTGVDRLLADDGGPEQEDRQRALLAAVQAFSRLTFLLGERPWSPAGAAVLSLGLGYPDAAAARAAWEDALAGKPLAEAIDTGALASRFRLTPGQIRDAVALAGSLASWRSPNEGAIVGADLAAACRAQSGSDLARVAAKVEPCYGWDDLVLPPDSLQQLREICDQARHRHIVLGEWGFDRRLSLGKGLNVLFSGPPGTGKTMAAEVLARELELDLYRIDLSRVVSKYIGETEKNLDRVFAAARSSNAILFFDEADALFGKRSEVKDSHDRYANVEVSYLLQKMEEHEGISILASNLRQHLDPAFLRRLAFAVHFPFPDEESRLRIWEGAWPAEAPLGEDVDFGVLARDLPLAGGNIKNIVLAAAYLAAAEAGRVRQSHLLWATRRELQKLGRTMPDVTAPEEAAS